MTPPYTIEAPLAHRRNFSVHGLNLIAKLSPQQMRFVRWSGDHHPLCVLTVPDKARLAVCVRTKIRSLMNQCNDVRVPSTSTKRLRPFVGAILVRRLLVSVSHALVTNVPLALLPRHVPQRHLSEGASGVLWRGMAGTWKRLCPLGRVAGSLEGSSSRNIPSETLGT